MNNILKIMCICLFCWAITACEKASNLKNPFDEIVRDTAKIVPEVPLDSSGIAGIHKYIFEVKCAIPSCHGVNFEPNFSSVQSTYNTLVYQTVYKNTSDFKFKYRVLPYDTAKSWLHERLVTDDAILGRMPRYAPPLTAREMYHINKWILSGAKNTQNQLPIKPNINVNIYGFGIYGTDTNYDENRTRWHDPCTVPYNQTVYFAFFAYDDETEVKNFGVNQIKISSNAQDFSNAAVFQTTYSAQYDSWSAAINTSQFIPGKTYFLRYYVKDTDHAEAREFPNLNTNQYALGHYSMTIQ